MNRTILLLFLIAFSFSFARGQSYKVHGKITNTRLEPLAFASVQVKQWKHGTVTKENGTYELKLEPGKYDLVISMIGYRSQVITIVIQKMDYVQNIILEPDDSKGLSEVVVKGKMRDRSEEIIRQVIRRFIKIKIKEKANKDRFAASVCSSYQYIQCRTRANGHGRNCVATR
jgi:hypothetical protein